MELLREFSIRQPNGKLKYFIEKKCHCGKVFTTRKDGKTKSCGCLKSLLDKTRRLGKPAFNRLTNTANAIERAAKNVFRQANYGDADVTFEQFLELSKLPCYYCGDIQANSIHLGIKKDGTQRKRFRKDKDGNKYQVNAWGSYLEDAHFRYNGLDRLDSSKKHSIDNVVPCCKICNFMKTNKSEQLFLTQVEKISKWQAKKI